MSKHTLAISKPETKSRIIPNPELKEAFEIFACGFKIGAIYGKSLKLKKQDNKAFLQFLETDEAQQMIYSLLLKEGDFEK